MEVIEGLRPLLREAVAMRMIADVPLGAFLSGGIDSGAVVATMAKEATSPVKAFTIGFGEEAFNEAPFARMAAKRFGVEHTAVVLTPDQVLAELPEALDALDQPSIDGVNTFYVSRAARQAGMTVALSGLGGDELFAGYSTFRNVPRMMALQSAVAWVPGPVRVGAAAVWARTNVASSATARGKEAALLAGDISSGHPYFLSRALFTPSQSQKLMLPVAREAHATANSWEQRASETITRAAEYDPVNAVSYMEFNHYLVSTLLRDADQMSMAHSLEVRVPLIDHKLVEYMMRVPGRYKLTAGDKTPKRLLVRAMDGALPDEIVNRRKTTFTFPWEVWLREQLRNEVEGTLGALPPVAGRYLEPGKVRETWKAFLLGRTSWSRPWGLYVLCRWLERNAA
jgi:asparagine synthase (glutamine-hydrolysing)